MYGNRIQFDPSKVYGAFDVNRQYRVLPIQKMLDRIAKMGNVANARKALDDLVGHYRTSARMLEAADASVGTGLVRRIGNQDALATPEKVRAVQNSISLFTDIANRLRPQNP